MRTGLSGKFRQPNISTTLDDGHRSTADTRSGRAFLVKPPPKKRSAASSTVAGGAAKPSQQTTIDPKGKGANPVSKQSRVIAMLQSPAGATITAMRQVAGRQHDSRRDF